MMYIRWRRLLWPPRPRPRRHAPPLTLGREMPLAEDSPVMRSDPIISFAPTIVLRPFGTLQTGIPGYGRNCIWKVPDLRMVLPWI